MLVETSKIASVLAAELGANVEIAKMGALLPRPGPKLWTTTPMAPTPKSARNLPNAMA